MSDEPTARALGRVLLTGATGMVGSSVLAALLEEESVTEVVSLACRNTGRKHFIMAGITTDVCLAPPAISAADEGFAVTAVVDASGSPTALTDEMAFRKMERGGVELTTTSALLAELAVNWASETGPKIMQILGEEILSRG
ncbi:isochorismatase family protein [Ruegeria sp. SCP11]|uniref:isochorismatase family protein n=1 Tax=Ruegeria sp. SCP11 TaxID=3141378 RepID=UPI0033364337